MAQGCVSFHGWNGAEQKRNVENGCRKKAIVAKTSIALGHVSFWLLCLFLSAGRLRLSLLTISSGVLRWSSLFSLRHWRVVWHGTGHTKVLILYKSRRVAGLSTLSSACMGAGR